MNPFIYFVEKDNTTFGWNGEEPAYETILPACIIPTNCRRKARAFVKKWALNNGFIEYNGRLAKKNNFSIEVRTNF